MLAIHAISLSVVSLLASATASTPCQACQIFPSCTMRTQCTSDEISTRPPLQALPSPKRVNLGSSMALLMLFSKYFWDHRLVTSVHYLQHPSICIPRQDVPSEGTTFLLLPQLFSNVQASLFNHNSCVTGRIWLVRTAYHS